MPGEFATGDLQIRAVRDLHSGAARLRDFPNVMFRLDAGGVSFLHIGDNRAEWPPEVSSSVGDIDVLLVTVDDSNHLLTYEQVDSLVCRLRPRVVIPMHYAIPGLTAAECELLPPDGWLAHQSKVRRLETDRVELSGGKLPSQTEVWVFQPARESLNAPPANP